MRTSRPLAWMGIAIATVLTLSACGTPVPTEIPTSTPAPTAEPTADDTMTSPEETAPQPTDSPVPTPVSAMSSPIETPEPTATEPLPTETPEETSNWNADGVVSEGEYASEADFGDMRLWWQHDGESLYIAMEGETQGWISVGINPERGMQGANYLFGYVEDGELRIWDAYGTSPTGANHPPDEDLGGTNDIVTSAGIEEDGVTRFEAQLPLDSGDQYDQPLTAGETYPIIVALGDADEFNAYHRRYDRSELVLAP